MTIIRVYDKAQNAEGYRLLVDRLWPRGISKDQLEIDLWMKEIAPSDELRKWYSHDPEKWGEFRSRYFSELDRNPLTHQLLDICRKKDVIFLYSSKVDEKNNAVALKEYVEEHL
ncbi:MAG: DUF488 family protein [Candidatus Thermoplasmatota archaeon]|nr:DUF488 family protein [Candidatus Thermoplasmatota archaeon]MCL5789735.1 DUF488 family protein [Candidatus Thermoplasmatota archaeon]